MGTLDLVISKVNTSENKGLEFFKEAEEAFLSNDAEVAIKKLKDSIEYFKQQLIKKPHCKLSRKSLVMCWDFLASSYMKDHSINHPLSDDDPVIKKNSVLALKNFIMDNFIECDWKKQYQGKYGGPKPNTFSWKEYYFFSEGEIDKHIKLEDKLKWTVKMGHFNYFQFLISQDDTINLKEIVYSKKEPLLSMAIKKNFISFIKWFLDKKVDINQKCDQGWTSLHYAAASGSHLIVKYLVSHSCNLNAKDTEHITPLHIAAHYNFHDVLKLLLKNGAKATLKNKKGYTPLHISVFNKDVQSAEELIRHGADINTKDFFGRTLLHWAASTGEEKLTEMLLSQGISKNAKDKLGRTALHYAAQYGHVNIMNTLIEEGCNLNMRDVFEETPLIVAAFSENTAGTSLLYEKGGVR